MFCDGEFGLEFVVLDQGKLLVRKGRQQLFANHGLRSFDDFMSTDNGQLLARRVGRIRMRMKLSSKQGGQVFYLKRHDPPGPFHRLAAALGLGGRVSNARTELRNIFHLSQAGLATITAAAVGEAGAAQGSFIMTEELAGYQSLHDYLAELPAEPGNPAAGQKRRQLMQALAHYTRRLHAAGMDHHDLYLCHFFVQPEDPAGSLTLLDLQRVRKHRRVRGHGRIKDLAALNYSAQQAGISGPDRLRFFLAYLQQPSIRELTRSQRRLLQVVARKTRRIGQHDRKLQIRQAQP